MTRMSHRVRRLAERLGQRVQPIRNDPVVVDLRPRRGRQHRPDHDAIGVVYLAAFKRLARIAQFGACRDQPDPDLAEHFDFCQALARQKCKPLRRQLVARANQAAPGFDVLAREPDVFSMSRKS